MELAGQAGNLPGGMISQVDDEYPAAATDWLFEREYFHQIHF